MFIFDNSVERVVPRRRALGYKSLVIEDNVTSACEAVTALEDGKIVIKLADVQEIANGEEPEMTLLLKEFGVFSNIKSEIEVTLCDGVMLITLIKGAIDIRINDQVMLASRGVDVDSITCQSLDSVVWVDVERFLSFCKFWCGMNKDYPYDYTYLVEVYGDGSGLQSLCMRPTNKDAFLFDISNGGLDKVEEARQLKQQIANAKDMQRLVVSSSESTYVPEMDDLDYNPDDYIDSEDDDDADDYDYCTV